MTTLPTVGRPRRRWARRATTSSTCGGGRRSRRLVYGGVRDRSRAGVAASAVSQARELIDDGWSLVVFPEGARSPDGHMQRFRHGTARLCIEARDRRRADRDPRRLSRRCPRARTGRGKGKPPVQVRYGEPLYPREGETHQAFSLRMTQAVAELHDEDRSTWWDALHRAEQGETPALDRPGRPRVAAAVGGLAARSSDVGPPRPGPRTGTDGAMPRGDGQERRTTIVEEAIRQFGREGYRGASLDQHRERRGRAQADAPLLLPHQGCAARGVSRSGG